MLEVKNLSVAYGKHIALNDISLDVSVGEIVVILGANGAGKSTMLKSVAGICEGSVSGGFFLDGKSLNHLNTDQLVEEGIALVPEGRGIFGDLTVKENLSLGAYSNRARGQENENLERVFSLFPKLLERQNQVARTMSGGEQQMVAIGRAIMSSPKILMLDEPSLGLSPILCAELFSNLSAIKTLGMGVLLVEQNAKQSLSIADRGYLLENSQIVHQASAENLLRDKKVQEAYLGANKGSGQEKSEPVETDKGVLAAPNKIIPSGLTPRRSADQQIGSSIDAIVNLASEISSNSTKGHSAVTFNAASQLASSKLATIDREIELAAERARSAVRKNSKPVVGRGDQSAQPSLESPRVIEVYRRPRVDVYKRKSPGQFERQ